MRRALLVAVLVLSSVAAVAQLKPRPDAFPPQDAPVASKAVTMASDISQMAGWDRYPTYETYLAMMQRWAEDYPLLCQVDTIGYSVRGRLILCMHIEGGTGSGAAKPQFFYSSTIHGDEVTGYVMMLRLIDTLLHGYGSNPQYTSLINRTRISINPLANPDGTYRQGNNTVLGAVRGNAHNIDLNRNYPDPFLPAKSAVEPENDSMIAYFNAHHFRLSANLHGGAEVMNYPWDCFTSQQNPHPAADWWKEVCARFVDTSRYYNANHFVDTYSSGYTAGGDWYVIHGGRQDYVNYYHNCLELTMEISSQKTLSSNRLPSYWEFLQHSLVNYIEEIHSLPDNLSISQHPSQPSSFSVYPNPAIDCITVGPTSQNTPLELRDINGRTLQVVKPTNKQPTILDISHLPAGVYLLHCGGATAKVVKVQ